MILLIFVAMHFLVRFIHKRHGFIMAALLGLLAIWPANNVHAQTYNIPKYRLLHFTSENGLPQNSVSTMQFDKQGNLWFGTQSGAVCFDGFSFKTTFTQKPSQRIFGTYKDRQDNIWIVDNLKNSYKVNVSNRDLIKPQASPDNRACDFAWLKLNEEDSSCKDYEMMEVIAHCYTITTEALYYYSEKQKTVIRYNGDKTPITKLEGEPYGISMVDNKLVIVLPNHKIQYFDKNNAACLIKVITGIEEAKDDVTRMDRFAMYYSDSVTLAIYNNNIYRLNIKQDTLAFTLMVADIPSIYGVSDCKYQESTDTYFISSGLTGLYIIQPIRFSVKTKTFKKDPGFFPYATNSIYTQVELDDGAIVDNQGVCFPAGNSKTYLLSSNASLTSWYKDRYGYIWYQSTDKKHLFKCNKSLQPVSKYIFPCDEYIVSMETIQNDEYIIATHKKIFLFKNNIFEQKADISPFSRGLQWLEKIERLNNANTVMALTKTGLYTFNLQDFQLSKMPAAPEANFRTIFKSRSGHYWLGSYGAGFFLLKNNQLIGMPIDRRENINNTNAILDDANGFLWISTNNGLFQIKETDLLAYAEKRATQVYYHYYDKTYGFNTNEFNGGTHSPAIALQNGNLSFSSLNGIVQFNPNSIRPLLPNNPINLQDLKVNGTHYNLIDSTVRLKTDFRQLDITVNSPYWGHPYNVQMESRIVGYDKEWQELELPAHITINYLPPGNYVLEVRKLAGFGENNYIIQRLKIDVAPPWYLSWWAIILAFVSLTALIALLLKLRVAKLQKQKNNLEAVVAERTNELSEKNKKLFQSNRQNEIVHSILLHDIKGPLKFIADVSEGLGENWSTLNEVTRHRLSTEIMQASRNVYHFVFDFLGWVKFKKEQNLRTEPFNLKAVLNEIINTKKHERKLTSTIIVENIINEQITVYTHKQVLQIILANIFDNSIKYTSAGKIIFSAAITDTKLAVTCTDTGRGMAKEKIELLLSGEKYRADNIEEDSFQLGYTIIKELLPLINGEIAVQSTVGGGTAVTIFLPYPLNR